MFKKMKIGAVLVMTLAMVGFSGYEAKNTPAEASTKLIFKADDTAYSAVKRGCEAKGYNAPPKGSDYVKVIHAMVKADAPKNTRNGEYAHWVSIDLSMDMQIQGQPHAKYMCGGGKVTYLGMIETTENSL